MRIVLLLALASSLHAQPAPYDVLLRGGTVVDGTGRPGVVADVAIRSGVIVRVGNLSTLKATTELDVRGRMVAPGFINVHSHADPRGLASAFNMLTQGVTTELLNADGGGPVDLTVQANQLRQGGLAVNVAASVPFNSIWASVNGLSDTRPDSAQRARMRTLVRSGLEAGAFGISAGLDYKPAYFSSVAEVIDVLAVAKPWRTFFTNHDRLTPESGYSSLVGMQETMTVGFGASMVPVFTHMKLQGRSQGNATRILDTMHVESQRGRWVAGDVYPYLSGQTMLVALIIPGWAQDGGVEKMRARFADSAQRARIVREADEAIAARFTGAAGILLGDDNSTLQQYMLGAQIASPGEAVVRILETRMPSAILGFGAEADLVRLIADPDIIIACDCGAASQRVAHPRFFGTFPRVLGRYVREQRVLPWEAAIRKMTWLPASLMGLLDRGLIAPGMAADLVVFDSTTVLDHATYANPTAPSTGIVHVVVNGNVALRDGKPTGAQSGRTLQRPAEGISRPAVLPAPDGVEKRVRDAFALTVGPNRPFRITAIGIAQQAGSWWSITGVGGYSANEERPFTVVYHDTDPRHGGNASVSVWLDGQYTSKPSRRR
ncbi:amidohydrolase family protein [Gemmatimonas sp.]|uniref:N-acyl-D-amino-acid deacylase family protein n=1 Tax=Gemmatimonas sp. TaxID=1962908 RepID=UPI00334064AF